MKRTGEHSAAFEHLSGDDLMKYHRHLLSNEERKLVEDHLRGCEFCADALKGISQLPVTVHLYQITHEIKKRIRLRKSNRKNIFSRTDIITLITVFFIIGLLLLIAYYVIVFQKSH
jgi:hypothetical protein